MTIATIGPSVKTRGCWKVIEVGGTCSLILEPKLWWLWWWETLPHAAGQTGRFMFACLQECVFASVYQTSEGMRVMLTSLGRSQNDSPAGDVAHVLWLIWFVHLHHIWHYFLNYFQFIPMGFSENSPLLCLHLHSCCSKCSNSVTKMELSCRECSCFHVSPSSTCLSASARLRRCYLELHQPSRWQIKARGRTRTAYHQQHVCSDNAALEPLF